MSKPRGVATRKNMSRLQPALVLGTVLLAFLEGEGRVSAEWPHVRGPNYDAISSETGLVEAWPETGPPVLWARELGQGYSGFVVVGGRAYTQLQMRTGQYVFALDADTGAEIWRQRVDWPWQPGGAYPGPYATPTWHVGRLYYATPTGLVGCLDANDGRTLWSIDVCKKFQSQGTEFGFAATPLIEDGRVILPVGGPGASMVALNADDGSTVWGAGDDPASYCPAFPITFRGRRLVVALLRNSLVAHDLATGQRLWRQALSSHYDEHSVWPLYAEPHLLIASPFRVGAQLFRLDEAATGLSAQTLWASRELSNDVCSSVLVGGQVYGFDLHQMQASAHRPSRGRFKCLDLATGAVRWNTDQVGQATVLAADGKLILLNDSGTLILARASATAYEELARARVLDGGLCWTPPALWHGRLFVRNHTHAACVFLGSPETLDPNRPPALTLGQGSSFDWDRLLTREPEYPHDEPSVSDVALWFGWCLVAVFGAAAGFAGVIGLAARLTRSARPAFWAKAAFVVSSFLIGLAGTTLFSAWADTFVFTWPASLYVAFRSTLAVGAWAEARPGQRRPRLAARAALLLFLTGCYGYYRLCLAVGYVMAWSFLTGFVPAAPAAIIAARTRRPWLRTFADVVGFSVYFWTSGLFPGWKAHWFG
jgi:outer membrane protein assembly factor BamB